MTDLDRDYLQACETAALFDVSARAKIQVLGKDAAQFLHNLCTNDVAHLAAKAGCEAFFATAQARLVAYVLVYHAPAPNGPDFWLDADPGMAEKIAQHLDRYLISEQVEIRNRTAEFAQFHLAGRAQEILAHARGGIFPNLAELQHDRMELASTLCFVRRHSRLGVVGFDVLCPTKLSEVVRSCLLAAGAQPASPETYEILRIETGTPVYGVDLDDSRLVMDVGRKQAVSYSKGCYLGQEPIVMARDRGHANRALLGLRFSESVAVRGTKLFLDGKEVGEVTSFALSPCWGAIRLGYIRRGHQEPGTKLGTAEGMLVEVLVPHV